MTIERRPTRVAVGSLVLMAMIGLSACDSARQSGPPASADAGLPSVPAAPSPSAVAVTPSPVVTPTPSASSLPTVAAAPTGHWAAISWLDAGHGVPLGPSNVQVDGWSRGYVAIATSGGDDGNGNVTPFVVTASASADGLHWSAAQTLDAARLDFVEIAGVVEGPSGLLLVGNADAGTCGGPAWVSALWSSVDGLAWRRLALPKDFRTSRVETLDGGSAGFIATGPRSDGTTPGIWFSRDGAAWRSLPVPKVSSGTVVVNGATSFADGLVLAGAVLGPDGCGGATSLHPSLWWSADGTRWSRDTLAGTSSSRDATMTVRRVSDHAVVAIESTSEAPELRAWISTDGRTWTRVASPPTTLQYAVRTDGRNAAVVLDPESGVGPPTITAVGDDLGLTELSQSGIGPLASEDGVPWTSTIGPTGILVVSVDGSTAWLGVPTSR
jgi:hypothetical protein